MFDAIGDVGGAIWDAVAPNFQPVDPQRGSQGAPRGGQSDGTFLGDLGQTLGDVGRGLSQEGLGGLFDPSGMMDRQSAQRELAGNFNVVPDGTPGIRSENQVKPPLTSKVLRPAALHRATSRSTPGLSCSTSR